MKEIPYRELAPYIEKAKTEGYKKLPPPTSTNDQIYITTVELPMSLAIHVPLHTIVWEKQVTNGKLEWKFKEVQKS